MKTVIFGFSNTMTKPQRIAGGVYLPLHIFVFPLLLGVLLYFFPNLTVTSGNVIYYGVGLAFCLIAMHSFLRRGFDILLDNVGKVLLSLVFCYIIYNLLSYLVSAVLLVVMGEAAYNNPNDATIAELAGTSRLGPMFGIAVFLAPIVEEVLFRGVVFGAIREKSRVWAYVISIAVFGIYHIWQYALDGFSWTLLLYALQYIPAGFAMARCYEQTNCIWAPIFLHMINNALAMLLM